MKRLEIRTAIALATLFVYFAMSSASAEDTGPTGTAQGRQALAWLDSVDAGRRQSQADNRPVLVRAGAPWCGWCEKLAEEIALPKAQDQLRRFTLVYLNVDESPAAARQLGIGPIPALRVLDRSGKIVGSRDGFLEQDDLVDWLKEQIAAITGDRPQVLLADKDLEEAAVPDLIQALASSDAVERETALRRLARRPKLAANPVLEAFGKATGKAALAVRLSALELLGEWGAPIESLDPWRPQTLTAAAQDTLEKWAASALPELHEQSSELTSAQRASAERDLPRLVDAVDTDADSMIERLARLGPGLSEIIATKLKDAVTDRARERLLTLRYRLSASDGLALDWPGGLARLAATDITLRHKAAEELSRRATSVDEPLLLELFNDPDPLVREFSLRALQKVSQNTPASALAKLLQDPEPNVRAAVLKQLADEPAAEMAPRIAQYAKGEKDPDLVVHAVRVLKATNATKSLMELLGHESWQVRAEAAEALGAMAESHRGDEQGADIFVALIDLLDDPDGFVVSRALRSLKEVDLPSAVEPLAKAAFAHPELAVEAIHVLTHTDVMRTKAEPHLRKFVAHEDPQLRGAAIAALIESDADDIDKIAIGGLEDPELSVRQSCAEAMFAMFNKQFDTAEFKQLLASWKDTEGPSLSPPEKPVDIRQRPAESADEQPEADPSKEKAPEDQVASDAEPKPAAEDKNETGRRIDAWLTAYYAGNGRPQWTSRAIEPLEKLLSAESPRLRLAATLALVPLGRSEQATAELSRLVDNDANLASDASGVLPWLLWTPRVELFRGLLTRTSDSHQLADIVEKMARYPDARAVDELWRSLGRPQAEIVLAAGVRTALSSLYGSPTVGFGQESKLDKATVAEITRYAESGTPWQKIVALAILIQSSSGKPEKAAAEMAADPNTSPEFRADAFQLQLLGLDQKEARAIAVRELVSANSDVRTLALKYLTQGDTVLHSLRGEMHVYSPGRLWVAYNEPVTVETPPGVTEEMLRPLLVDPDGHVAACAGYLLATMGHTEGLEPLLRAWRGKESGAWVVPVYQAIAALDDDSQTPILDEINKKLPEHDKRQFYWTIRSMHGPGVLKLRKQIRDQVGMDNLR